MFVLVREILGLGEVKYKDCAYLEIEYENEKFKVLNKVRCEFNWLLKSKVNIMLIIIVRISYGMIPCLFRPFL